MRLQQKQFTKEQQRALLRLYRRRNDEYLNRDGSYLKFRRTAYYSYTMGCVLVPWCGMTVGIETDGHIHT